MLKTIKHLLILVLCFATSLPCYADLNSYSLLGSKGSGIDRYTARGNEFISGAQPGKVLMKVNLWGGVGKPGIHHVPAKTNLINLLSYAGGPLNDAMLNKVTIKRNTGPSNKKIIVNVQDIIEGASIPSIPLEPNDIVVVPQKKPTISNNTIAIVSVVAMVVSTAATAYYISRDQERR